MIKKHFTDGKEEEILRELLLDVNEFYFFVPRNTTGSDNIKQRIKSGLLKCFSITSVVGTPIIMGAIGFLLSCINDERMRSEILIQFMHIIEIIFPYGVLLTWANQSRDIIKLFHLLPKVYTKKPDDLMKMYKQANLKRKIIICLNPLLGCLLTIFNYVTNAYSSGRERTGDIRYVSGMIMPLWFPFETNYIPVKQFLILDSFVLIIFVTPIYSIIMPFVFVFSGWIECRIRHLIRTMKVVSLSRKQDIKIVRKNLNDILSYHTGIARSFAAMNNIFAAIALPHFFLAVPALSLLLTISYKEFNLFIFLQFIFNLVGLYYTVHVLQGISDVGEELYEAAYNMDWYDMDYRLRNTFSIFFMKVQKPLLPKTIFGNFDRVLFLGIVKCSYSYFMYLNNSKI